MPVVIPLNTDAYFSLTPLICKKIIAYSPFVGGEKWRASGVHHAQSPQTATGSILGCSPHGAGVAELADAAVSKTVAHEACGFESHHPHSKP